MAADFTASPLTGFTPFDVTFTDESTPTASTWLWNFGDGATSSVQNPTHTYVTPGDFDVTLTVDTDDEPVVKTAYLHVKSGYGILLPELLLPASIPPFLADGHNVQFTDVYGNVSWSKGEDSKRRLYTIAPRIVSVSLDLSTPQMLDFYNWFEGPCAIGTQWFSALLANLGPGLYWFKSRFSTPYIATPDENGTRWELKFNLYVLGEGSSTPPTRTSFVSGRGLLLEGSAVATTDRFFESSRSMPLETMNYAFNSQRHLDLS